MHFSPLEVNFIWGHKINKGFSCGCPESAKNPIEWTWAMDYTKANITNEPYLLCSHKRTVTFHPFFSTGTVALRGERAFELNNVYYYELIVGSSLQGTDTSIGLATQSFNLNQFSDQYKSYLGSNEISWGFSHKGLIRHNNLCRKYGETFSQGDTIGVCVDMCNGTIEYYINGKPQGIAFNGINKFGPMFPIICTTTKQATFTLLTSDVYEADLQSRCLKVLDDHYRKYSKYALGDYKVLFRKFPVWLQPKLLHKSLKKDELIFDELLWSD